MVNNVGILQVTNSSVTVRDKCYDGWFAGNNVLKNIVQPIQNVLVPGQFLDSAGVLVRRSAMQQSTTSSELESLLTTTNSSPPNAPALAGAALPVVGAGLFPSSSQMALVAAASGGNGAAGPQSQATTAASLPAKFQMSKYRSQGVSTDPPSYATETLAVNESILTLVNKLYTRFADSPYVPLAARDGVRQQSCDGQYYVGRLLDVVSANSPESARFLDDVYRAQHSKRQPGEKETPKMDKEERSVL